MIMFCNFTSNESLQVQDLYEKGLCNSLLFSWVYNTSLKIIYKKIKDKTFCYVTVNTKNSNNRKKCVFKSCDLSVLVV